jgi:protein involved in polysaccharide export with SLBB domain
MATRVTILAQRSERLSMRYLLAILLMLFPLFSPAQETEAAHIRPGDRLRLSVRRNSNISCSVVVRSDGSISIPLLNDVKVEGLTVEEMQELLVKRLQPFVANPEVTVTNFDHPKPATLPAIWPFLEGV